MDELEVSASQRQQGFSLSVRRMPPTFRLCGNLLQSNVDNKQQEDEKEHCY